MVLPSESRSRSSKSLNMLNTPAHSVERTLSNASPLVSGNAMAARKFWPGVLGPLVPQLPLLSEELSVVVSYLFPNVCYTLS